jgi:serine/threonine protein kinase/cytochrome c-type biogenesis protein CcmH/NrfG
VAVSSNTVLGKYRIIREIARSNDIVYEAIDPTMARRVAIKELQLPPHLAGAQKRERIERFYREAKAAGTLSHRNIVTIHDVGQENERHFLVMEYLEGQSLRDILQMQGALPLKETVEITLQMCDALSYAHSRGVVHRDIKPDNIHILPGGVIKLTDFGIARITAEPSITTQGQVFGTPSYMSPEQVASNTVDHRTDLFSLGITLYEMLAGRKPFSGDSVITITYNIMNIQPAMPVGVPSALQQILQHALAKDPNQRYQNAAAMAADLRAEKFALAAPQSPAGPAQVAHAARPAPLTFVPGAPMTLDTGTVPPEISGMPVSPPPSVSPPPVSTPYPTAAQAYPAAPPPAAAPFVSPAVSPEQKQNRLLPPGSEKWFRLALPILGLIALLLLIAWGIFSVLSAMHAHAKSTEAGQLVQQADSSFQQGHYAEAAKTYQQAATVAPANSEEAVNARTGQSVAYAAQGKEAAQANDLPAARDAYQAAVQYNPGNAAALDNLGNIDWQSGKVPEALDAWEHAAQADPTSAAGKEAQANAVRHYKELAQTAANQGNLSEARRNWQKITEIDPGSDDAFQAVQNISRADSADTVPANVGLTR